ncbi:flagellar protein export ATPase FliI [Limnobacter humi]|uniref:Flagellum-specific ATP synthase n=1 Tax=Limnobacter humi TaxID=1778671 RepID=A0ABT1WKN2_9BURK|nr:flagellar protein export ATPase FliI [Limnobacter humi]MCQ8897517.1 flagellar protein export ATPase FliI [Limnobacter humi]
MHSPVEPPSALLNWLDDCTAQVVRTDQAVVSGRLMRVQGLVVQAAGLELAVGTLCHIHAGLQMLEAEVVGFSDGYTYLMPHGETAGLRPGLRITPQPAQWPLPRLHQRLPAYLPEQQHSKHLPVGDGLLGRVLDANARPLDGLGPIRFSHSSPLAARAVNPIERVPVRQPIDVGVRAINALLTVGKGQRLGLFAGSGVGKSVLLGMMARFTSASRIVVGLIGERGREVKEFIEDILGEDGLKRSVVVAAPADSSALLRLQGAAYASTLAEHFRDQGHDVLLIMDSLTRYAQAQREIALAIGEAPATKGYPPSVFAKLPALVERAGNSSTSGGSITAFYTVLSEGDDQQDPIADAARAILDGHFVLSRKLAEQGHYPALDIEQSISRVMHNVTETVHMDTARYFKALYSKYTANQDLISIGAYQRGADPMIDKAIDLQPAMRGFLQQGIQESCNMLDSLDALARVFNPDATAQ